MSKKGFCLINVGTPEGTSVSQVRAYLYEFLNDPRMIALPYWKRQLLLRCIILPFRSGKSAKAYRQIWDKQRGSPLRYHMQDLVQAMNQAFPNVHFALGMRYGTPSISSAISQLLDAGCEEIVIVPLYPQYSSASTGSAIAAAMKMLSEQVNVPNVSIYNQFFDNPHYLDAQAKQIRPFWQNEPACRMVFSFHSLPWYQIAQSAQCNPACRQQSPCPAISQETQYCYRGQCYETAKGLALRLSLPKDKYTVVFQSRLGRIPWVGPDLIQQMPGWIQAGDKQLVVACPSFVTDCLETLEEVGVRAREEWLSLGGTSFQLVPCLNSEPHWVNALSSMLNLVPSMCA